MQSLQARIIAQFIELNNQVIHWDFQQGKLPESLIDQIKLVRRWAWDNRIGPDELQLAFLIHQRANATVIGDFKRTMKSWQYYKDKQDRRQRLEASSEHV